jgi:predicted phosphodiesterase
MRVAVISDTHGDLDALNAVLADLDRQEVDEVLVAGDTAQGGPHPREVVDLLRERGWPVVLGNADEIITELAAGRPAKEPLRQVQIDRANFSIDQLGPERIEFLASLPMSVRTEDGAGRSLVVVHAAPWDNQHVLGVDSPEAEAERAVREAGATVVAHGHIHSPYQRRVGDAVLLSVGAVAMSGDADPRPAYSIVALGDVIEVEVRRIDYDGGRQPGLKPVQSHPGIHRLLP